MKLQDFKIGQRVSIWDEDDNKKVLGAVAEIHKEAETISIKWDDFREPTLHDSSDFNNIQPA